MLTRTTLVSLVLTVLAVSAGCTTRLSDEAPAVDGRGPADLAPGRDSIVRLEDGSLGMLPITRLSFEKLDECSGMVRHRGAFFAHNDSGDAPVLYRSTSLDFTGARILPIPDAIARDWEDICTIGEDLLVFDIGDNGRERDDLAIYRVRYREASGDRPERLEHIATYPIAYPDGRHDAEAGFSIDGAVYIVSKARGERETYVYRFDSLRDTRDLDRGTRNVPTRVATLDVGEGEMVTAGTFDPNSRRVLLLTYSAILAYPVDAFRDAPARATRIWARQCESLCVFDGRVVVTNEERDVFLVSERDLERSTSLVPPRAHLAYPGENAESITLRNASPGDMLSWFREGDVLHMAFAIMLDEAVSITSAYPPTLGGSIVFMFGNGAITRVDASHTFVAIGRSADGDFRAWRFDGASGKSALIPYDGATVTARVRRDSRRRMLEGDVTFPLSDVVRDADEFLFDARTLGLREDGGPYVSGLGEYSMYRPYTWSVVRHRTSAAAD